MDRCGRSVAATTAAAAATTATATVASASVAVASVTSVTSVAVAVASTSVAAEAADSTLRCVCVRGADGVGERVELPLPRARRALKRAVKRMR